MKFAVLIISALTLIGLASAGEALVGGGGSGNVEGDVYVSYAFDIRANCCLPMGKGILQALASCTLPWRTALSNECDSSKANICNVANSLLAKYCSVFQLGYN